MAWFVAIVASPDWSPNCDIQSLMQSIKKSIIFQLIRKRIY